MARSFRPDLIEIRNNPFSSTRSVSISEGIYMQDLVGHSETYISNTDSYVDIGFLSILLKKAEEIEASKSPQHLFIMGEYGQGKSFSLKKLQDVIYSKYNGGIISYPIGGNSETLLNNTSYFEQKVMENIESLFSMLDDRLYLTKNTLGEKYGLSDSKTFAQFLDAYDKTFQELGILVYIFVDELDKIVLSSSVDSVIKSFLENLKLIGDACGSSISLILAGTTNCLEKMNTLSIDYAQRFDKIEFDYLTIERTSEYINKKCQNKLDYSGYYPFDNYVKHQIYHLTQGNIRNVEAICRDLWIYSSRTGNKVTRLNFNGYLKQALYEPVKSVIGRTATDVTIGFITDLYLKHGRAGRRSAFKSLSGTRQREIERYVEASNGVSIVGQSFVLERDIIARLENALF